MACLLVGTSPGSLAATRDDAVDTSLRETVHNVPVPGAGTSIVVTSYHPQGNGPFPRIVLSQGTAITAEANRTLDRYRIPA
jgi:hypothetical protein